MRIKAVSEYIKVRTRRDEELPCVAIERDGTCRLTIRYSDGISQSQMINAKYIFILANIEHLVTTMGQYYLNEVSGRS